MKRRHLHIIATIIVATLLATMMESCRTADKSGLPTTSSGELRNATDAKIELRTIVSTYSEWERLRIPVNIKLNSPQSASISGSAIFERDKSVFISLRFLGFEVANIYATNDSIFVVDKYNKQYAAEDIHQFLGNAPINIANVQDLLLGRVFLLGRQESKIDALLKSDIDITSSNSWSLIPKDQVAEAEYGFLFKPANNLQNVIIKSANHEPVVLTYTPAEKTAKGPIAPSLNLTYNTGKKLLNADFNWNTDKAVWNTDVELRRPSISSKYRRITAEQIALMLSKF